MVRADDELRNPIPPRIARGGWLDALRFIVGALIILYHFREASPVPLPQLHPVFDRGYLLTDFFIIDSGYVLARIYGDRLASGQASLRAYARQRLLRVIPAHLVVSLILVVIVGGAALAGVTPSNPRWFDWSQLPAQVLLVQAWGVPGGQGWNAPTWTLSALIGCYLLLPWICRALWRWPPVVVLIGAAVLVVVADVAASVWLGDPIYRLPMRYGILRALPLFLLGVAAAFYGSRVYVSPRRAGAIGVGAGVALVVLQAFGAFSLLSLGLMTVIIWGAGAMPVLRPSRLVEHLALMSFSMFLTNEVSRIVWFGFLDALGQDALSASLRWALWSIGFAGAFVAAAVFRYGFDRPVQTWLNPPGVRRAAGEAAAGPASASGAVVSAEHAG
ncbi:acyltransferase [Brevundimonas sp. AJA228-03]|uniref:acyltransferase family protein n=1 Tax=Brevundimonas sp. AJA228-03 TaxID=2752515 RepID=UPI001AE0450C|nr:acyltransferase [Brevundimonas sp. AJA228-03]QTN20836.1 acyltransferase [Brevundimonas sp. AJA228-03]